MLKHTFITLGLVLVGTTSANAQFVSPEDALMLDYFGTNGASAYNYQQAPVSVAPPSVDPNIRAQELLESANYKRSRRLGDTAYASAPYVVQPQGCIGPNCNIGNIYPNFASSPVMVDYNPMPPVHNLKPIHHKPLVQTGVGTIIGSIMLLCAFGLTLWQLRKERKVVTLG